jgi:hypothetical protein
VALDLATIRSRVRLLLDVDADELPSDLIDQWCREATYRIAAAIPRWPWFEKTWTLSVTSGTAEYTLSSVDIDIGDVTHVRGDNRELREISIEDADFYWQRNVTPAGDPTHYVLREQKILLYPTPSRSEDLLLRGFRKVTDWVAAGAGATPDFPEQFYNTVYLWVVSRAYAMQEDDSFSMHYFDLFQNELDIHAAREGGRPTQQPLVLGGGKRMFHDLPAALRYPFD